MNAAAAIHIRRLSKRYRIGAARVRPDNIREALLGALAGPFWRLARLGKEPPTQETIWALKDVSLEVQPGELLGVIGRNGAGKSTLLKILSRITDPTEGRIELRGRSASLLEIGTGFHPELTGRENVYLNGTILGMRRAEIERKFEQIVSFAELAKFIDTPVKRYSSGMYVRLAFAVAAHLEVDILLVDEVLAVGDAEFQKRCLGKIHDVAQGGRTVLFVSHNLGAIRELCPRTILLDAGRLVRDGDTAELIAEYLRAPAAQGPAIYGRRDPDPSSAVVITRAWIADEADKPVQKILQGQPFSVVLEYSVREHVWLRAGFELWCEDGTPVVCCYDTDGTDWQGRPRQPGRYVSSGTVKPNPLAPGKYTFTLRVGQYGVRRFAAVEHALSLEVECTSTLPDVADRNRLGAIQLTLPWRVEYKAFVSGRRDGEADAR